MALLCHKPKKLAFLYCKHAKIARGITGKPVKKEENKTEIKLKHPRSHQTLSNHSP